MGVFYHTILGDNFNFEMSFNTSYGVNYNFAQFLFLLSSEFAYSGHIGVV